MHRLSVRTERREQMLDITDALAGAITELGIEDGAVLVHVPHTTAAVTVNEGYDPDVAADVLAHLSAMVPVSPAFAHAEGNSDSHIKAILIGCAHPIAVEGGLPALGRWQRVFLCEFDGPRTREVWVTPLRA
ncbi:MAG TPA: secondary thiamine-phosphate synthase enzyme YjbQ [Gaiellales bacterium]|nr:secondary thiamine-phosphate synthase enzyme YjbQ [Gaiellales bacterium]